MKRLLFVIAAAALAVLTQAEAGVISSISTFSLPGFSTGSVSTSANPAPNNDDTTDASTNVIPYSVFFNSPGRMETEFAVTPSGGTTEYRYTQSFVNNSGVTWYGFLFELGFGLGPSFVPAAIGYGLDFDAPSAAPAPTSSTFPALALLPVSMQWSGATVVPIGATQFTFAIDVPDGLPPAGTTGISRFTLRQTPITEVPSPVPEPAGSALLGVALAAAWVGARQRGVSRRARAGAAAP